MKKYLLTAVSALALSAGAAHAGCVSSAKIFAPDPTAGTSCSILADATTMPIVVAGGDAADVDVLANGKMVIASNRDPQGTTILLTGLTVGKTVDLTFTDTLTDVTGAAGVKSADGAYHVALQSSYTDFQTDPPRTFWTTADLGNAYSAMTSIAPIGNWIFAGFEDRLASYPSDWDFNDFVVAFDNPGMVPEPSALAIAAFGLLLTVAYRKIKAA